VPGFFPSFSTVNFYAGNRLSRFSWKRNDSSFLNAALTSPQAKFIILQRLNPLIHSGEGERQGKLATLSWNQVEPTIRESLALSHGGGEQKGTDVFGPQANHLPVLEGESSDEKKFAKVTEGLVPTSLALVFLGIDEGDLSESSLPGDLASKDGTSNTPAGIPYFALSVSHRGPASSTKAGLDAPIEKLEQDLLRDGQYDFVDTRSLAQAGTWDLHDAAVVAQARSLIDWNERHQVRDSMASLTFLHCIQFAHLPSALPIFVSSSAQRAVVGSTVSGPDGNVLVRPVLALLVLGLRMRSHS
jgi:NAD+ diphosphatase